MPYSNNQTQTFTKQDIWYKKSPCGINTIGSYMADIRHAAGLNYIHTTDCSRGTTATCIKKAGYSLEEITWAQKHKNLESLKRYLAKPSMEDKENLSNDPFKATGDSDSDSDDANSFNPPPPPKKKKQKKNVASTISKPPDQQTHDMNEIVQIEKQNDNQNQLVPLKPNDQVDLPENQITNNQIMQMYKQNPFGMFVGVTLSNCTININMPK